MSNSEQTLSIIKPDAVERKLEKTRKSIKTYNENASKGNYKTIYKFNHEVLEGIDDLEITQEKIKLKGYKKEIHLKS